MSRKIIILTDGQTNMHAKTAISVIRYRREEVVALFDREAAGSTSQELLSIGGDLPVVGTLDDAPGADTLMIGIAPPGGHIPAPWRPIVLEAIHRGMTILSGLHDFFSEDPEFAAAAAESGAELIDVRKSNEREIAVHDRFDERCLRILAVGNACSCGKMAVAIETQRELSRRGRDAKFIATGQTGIFVEGDGCAIDAVVADFVSGTVERLVLANQHHEIVVVEGQGTLVDCRYSGVTLSLLHGCAPDGLIMCYRMGQDKVDQSLKYDMPPLDRIKAFYEMAANFIHPCEFVGIAVNGYGFTEEEVAAECEKVSKELGLPACDIYRHGSGVLADAVEALAAKKKAVTVD